jgi:hypothetical protein
MIQTYKVTTYLGICQDRLPFLTVEEQTQFDNLFSGSSNMDKIETLIKENIIETRTNFLNNLGIGEFHIEEKDPIKHNVDYIYWLIVHVPNEEFLNRKVEVEKLSFPMAFGQYIIGQKIKGTYCYDVYEGIECTNGYKYVSCGTGMLGGDVNTALILDKDDNTICELDW